MLKIKDVSKGRYWQVVVELVSGCTPCSPGCDHCWSAALAHRFYREGEPCHESGLFTDASGRFNGDIVVHPERLKRLNTGKPKVFSLWNDVFHISVPFDFIDEFHKINMDNLHNTILLLTKRPERMGLYYQGRTHWGDEPNIYKGLTICNQHEADKKIPIFLQVPGKKFLSIEPILTEINLPLNDEFPDSDGCYEDMRHRINAVILGCETGTGARPMDNEWAISIVQKCKSAGVPVFVKQISINGKPSKNIDEWPEELRMRELPWGR